MAYQTVILTNEPLLGGVKISSTKAVGAPIDATSVIIKRKETTAMVYDNIATIAVASVDDLTFQVIDRNVLTGRMYDYLLTPVVGDVEQLGAGASVAVSYSALFITDSTGTYMAPLDITCTAQKNTQVSYVQPLKSKYPHAVRNGDANYSTGNAEGMFLTFTGDCTPDLTNSHTYKESVLEMLVNGLPKVLRVPDGRGWYISVDGDPKRNTDEFLGADTISFSWTEIGALPKIGVSAT
jgi:hypothetical protein